MRSLHTSTLQSGSHLKNMAICIYHVQINLNKICLNQKHVNSRLVRIGFDTNSEPSHKN